MGGAALEKHVIDAITTKRCEIEQATTGGEYLPLSVWKQRGFDPEQVSLSKDRQEHPILGTCFRVVITGVLSKTIEEMVRKELLHSKRPGPDVQTQDKVMPRKGSGTSRSASSKPSATSSSSSSA